MVLVVQGKAISQLLAEKLGWHLLDSGAIYRVLAAAIHRDFTPEDEESLVAGTHLDVKFEADEEKSLTHIILEGEDVTLTIRTKKSVIWHRRLRPLPRVREALLRRQRGFKELPGLVADGRDMGTVVFTDADAKVFLTASAEERAQRRFDQLKEKGFDANIDQLVNEIKERDDAMNRSVTLKPAEVLVFRFY